MSTTREEQIAAIRAACIKANPEIEKEWSDCKGCSGVGFTAEHEGGQACYEGECSNCPVQVQCDPCMGSGKCLGRPVRLADVLLAIEEKYQRRIANSIAFDITLQRDANEGDEYKSMLKTALIEILMRWNLRTDDLTAQSDECIAFLAELLKA